MNDIAAELAADDFPGEVIKEELWRNISGNELSDKPHNVADKIMSALEAAGYTVVRVPPHARPDVGAQE